jgi:hypothetical protein
VTKAVKHVPHQGWALPGRFLMMSFVWAGKAFTLISRIFLFGRDTRIKLTHPAKAPEPMEVTEPGSVIFCVTHP